MLIKESYRDVETKSGGTMRIIIIEPHVPEYPNAKFPGCVVFSEVCPPLVVTIVC
jgi:carboxymethylenebutenolidase